MKRFDTQISKQRMKQAIVDAKQDDEAAQLLLQSHLYNPCLYHAQQAIEKCLKALTVEQGWEFQRPHSIRGLVNICARHAMPVELEQEGDSQAYLMQGGRT